MTVNIPHGSFEISADQCRDFTKPVSKSFLDNETAAAAGAPTRADYGESARLGVALVSSTTRWRCPQGIVLLPVTDLDLPLPFEPTWLKDNGSSLLANFVAAVRVLPEVVVFAKSANQRTPSSTIGG
jgi:hypothetical protein